MTIRPTRPAEGPLTQNQALRKLVDGHRQYHDGKAGFGDYRANRIRRARGQSPVAAVLSCADSRVPPELVFNQEPGGLFTIRVAGNVESAETLASLEYGIHFLGISLIVVLGHSGCGAIEAAIKVHRDGAVLPGHLPGLVDLILPAVRSAEARGGADLVAEATIENVRNTMRTISETEPVLAARIRAGAVRVVGGVYDLATGKVTLA